MHYSTLRDANVALSCWPKRDIATFHNMRHDVRDADRNAVLFYAVVNEKIISGIQRPKMLDIKSFRVDDADTSFFFFFLS